MYKLPSGATHYSFGSTGGLCFVGTGVQLQASDRHERSIAEAPRPVVPLLALHKLLACCKYTNTLIMTDVGNMTCDCIQSHEHKDKLKCQFLSQNSLLRQISSGIGILAVIYCLLCSCNQQV